ncbi:MAG: DUF3604 domain-containing protein [Verrucomicrobia bacterium]|nr:MAG: DUF3604 domain-containing protein [Verrucomicrobiota bacterium]
MKKVRSKINTDIDLGKARIVPSGRVKAGSLTTIRFTYTVGHPIDDTGSVKIVFRYAGDFGVPQLSDPSAPNYCSIQTTGDCRIEPRWDPKGHTRPWDRTLMLKVMGGYLDTGDTLTVVFGDTSGGSPGWRMQTFCESSFEFKTLVDPIASYQFKELPKSPVLTIVPGKAVRALCVAPSQIVVGKAFSYFVKEEDAWGNPVKRPTRLRHPGFKRAGTRRLRGKVVGSRLSALSNPIAVVPELSRHQRFWADLHGQSEETIGTNSIEDYFRFARDYALVDAAAHQGNDFQIEDSFWDEINRVTRKFNHSGKFVTFPGYEWSGNTPLGGDRNVWYTREGGPIHRSSLELLRGRRSKFPTADTADELFNMLREQSNPAPFFCAHVGGRYADLKSHDPGREYAVEVHSAWGTFEWMIHEALKRGYRIGISANSDGHKGRPGASYPGAGKFGSLGGLTCYLARNLDRRGLLEAMRNRRFYGTTGNRPLIDFSVTDEADGRRVLMGGVLKSRSAPVLVRGAVAGTGPVEQIQIRTAQGTVKAFYNYGDDDLGARIKVTWSGARVRGRDRMVRWDGRLKVVGNSILDTQAINFWNSESQPRLVGRNGVEWESVTTGGVAGLILRLRRPDSGRIEIETPEGKVSVSLKEIGRFGRTWDYGGVAKQLKVTRLPDKPLPMTMQVEHRIEDLKPGDNPIYMHVIQEDGHMAWTSPVYVEVGDLN